MKLRNLEMKDIDGMLEWMHDEKVNQWFCFNAAGMGHDDACRFIQNANAIDSQDCHFAIVDDCDEYLGTISLKHMDKDAQSAEFAISLRSKAQGMGVATEATQRLLWLAFHDLQMNRVYLNVLSDNLRAIHLYEKCGFQYEGEFRNHLCLRGKLHSLKWYAMLKDEFDLKYQNGN